MVSATYEQRVHEHLMSIICFTGIFKRNGIDFRKNRGLFFFRQKDRKNIVAAIMLLEHFGCNNIFAIFLTEEK